MESCEGMYTCQKTLRKRDKNFMTSGFSNRELFLDRAFVSFPGAADRSLL